MRKKEFIKALAERSPHLPDAVVARLSNKIIAQIIGTLKNGGRVEIRGFGSFFNSTRRPRRLVSPSTQQTIDLPAKRMPRFKPGKALSKKVDYPQQP